MPTETSMKRTVLSLSALLLCAASARAAKVVMPGAKPAAPAPGAAVKSVAPALAQVNEVEKVVREAAQLEKSDGCEAAYIRYKEAGDKLITMRDQKRAAQLQGIVTNKMDKLQTCYSACQPNDNQSKLFTRAKESLKG